jgi:hypothetical protein
MSNWVGICTTDKEKPTIIANVAAQKAAAERLTSNCREEPESS